MALRVRTHFLGYLAAVQAERVGMWERVSETTGGGILPPSLLDAVSQGGRPDEARRSPRPPLMKLDGFQSVPTFCQSSESNGRHSGATFTSVRGLEAQAY